MTKMVGMKIQGLRRLGRKLTTLEKKIGKKISRQAVRAGGKIILKQAKKNARKVVGGQMGKTIARNLVLRTQKKQQRGSYGMNVMISKKGNPDLVYTAIYTGKRTYIPAAIEYGHTIRIAGKTVGNAKPIPFMRGGFAATRQPAKRKIIAKLLEGIEQEVRA